MPIERKREKKYRKKRIWDSFMSNTTVLRFTQLHTKLYTFFNKIVINKGRRQINCAGEGNGVQMNDHHVSKPRMRVMYVTVVLSTPAQCRFWMIKCLGGDPGCTEPQLHVYPVFYFNRPNIATLYLLSYSKNTWKSTLHCQCNTKCVRQGHAHTTLLQYSVLPPLLSHLSSLTTPPPDPKIGSCRPQFQNRTLALKNMD